jgi:hypothetical protein
MLLRREMLGRPMSQMGSKSEITAYVTDDDRDAEAFDLAVS